MSEKIYRLHYRGQLKEDISEEALEKAVKQCVANVRQAQKQGRVLTAALYRADRMLFFYYEALGTPLSVTEPIAAQGAQRSFWSRARMCRQPVFILTSFWSH